MVDFLSPAERSVRMSRIKSKDTVPEVALRKALHALGFRFRLNGQKLPGKPDIVLGKYRTAIFVHGCFWHRHSNCRIATTPKSNTAFWVDKFDRNVQRDARVSEELETLGWRIIIVWECELSSQKAIRQTAATISCRVRANINQAES